MTGPIVRAVTTATKMQLVADADNTPARFDAYWRAFTPTWAYQLVDGQYLAQLADEAVRGGRHAAA